MEFEMSSNYAISVKSAGGSLTSDYYEVFDASNTIIGWISRTDAETDDVLTWDVFFASRAYDEPGDEFASFGEALDFVLDGKV
jgi:hypothetical protein